MAVLTDRQAKTISQETGAMAGGVMGLSLIPTNKSGKGRWQFRLCRRLQASGAMPCWAFTLRSVSKESALRSVALTYRAMLDDKTNPRDLPDWNATVAAVAQEAPTIPTFERGQTAARRPCPAGRMTSTETIGLFHYVCVPHHR